METTWQQQSRRRRQRSRKQRNQQQRNQQLGRRSDLTSLSPFFDTVSLRIPFFSDIQEISVCNNFRSIAGTLIIPESPCSRRNNSRKTGDPASKTAQVSPIHHGPARLSDLLFPLPLIFRSKKPAKTGENTSRFDFVHNGRPAEFAAGNRYLVGSKITCL